MVKISPSEHVMSLQVRLRTIQQVAYIRPVKKTNVRPIRIDEMIAATGPTDGGSTKLDSIPGGGSKNGVDAISDGERLAAKAA